MFVLSIHVESCWHRFKLKSFYNSSLIAAYVRANHSEYCTGQCTHRTLVQLASTQFKALEQREHKVYSRTLACHLHASRARALISSSKGSMDVTRVSARECQVKLELYRIFVTILVKTSLVHISDFVNLKKAVQSLNFQHC